jgi:hypothetical protein
MNSENFGTRIMWNEALDQKIWVLKDYRGTTVLSGGSTVFLGFLEWLEGLGANDRVFGKILGIFGSF